MFGVLPINKPQGMTSRDVVNRISKLVKPHRVGHTGTLDPMATGVLLLAIGHSTRLVEFSLLQSKEYVAEFCLGKSSDTLDADGVVLEIPTAPAVSRDQLQAALPAFVGDIQQTPPRFSAVHVDGKRAYDLARKGKEFTVPPRTVRIHELELLHSSRDGFGLRIDCGSGTYIRTLGSDLARTQGSDAVMAQLIRTRIGIVRLEQCVELEALTSAEDVHGRLLPVDVLLTCLPRVVLDARQADQIRNGVPLTLALDNTIAGPWLAVDTQQQIVAILTQSGSRYRSLRVFHMANETSQPVSMNSPHSPES